MAIPSTDRPADSLVIFLHGVGSRGADLAPLADAWREVLPTTAFAAPDGPHPCDQGDGRQWFSILGVTDDNRPPRVRDARPAFDDILRRLIDRHGLSARPDRVALVGFSQGAIMALDALASGRWPVGAVVAFSGRLASPAPLTPAAGARALLIHGAADPVIAASRTVDAAAVLAGLGVDATHHLLPGVGHTITATGAALAGRYLADLFTA